LAPGRFTSAGATLIGVALSFILDGPFRSLRRRRVAHTSAKRRDNSDEQIAALREPGSARNEQLFDATERAILRFTDLLTTHPGNVNDSDLDDLGEYLDQEQVIELVFALANASWTNRVTDGLRTPMPA
jgi:alkylhydroperoxidase family enzyme